IDAPEIDQFAAPGDPRSRGLLYFFAGDLHKAREFFKQADAAAVQPYLDRIDALEAEELESRARQAWAAADAVLTAKRWEAAQQAFTAFKTAYGKTKFAESVQEPLKEKLDQIEEGLHPYEPGLVAVYFKKDTLKDEDIATERIDKSVNYDS